MKTLTVTEVARSFSSVLDRLERDQEEVVLVRHNQTVARLIPEPPAKSALEVFADLFRVLDDETADALSEALKASRKGKARLLKALKNPWAS